MTHNELRDNPNYSFNGVVFDEQEVDEIVKEALSSQKQQMIEEIEGMKLDVVRQDQEKYRFQLTHNMAIDTVLTSLKEGKTK